MSTALLLLLVFLDQGSRCWELITHATIIWGNLTHCPDMFIHRLHSMVHLDNLRLGKSHQNHREISAFYKGYHPSKPDADKLSTPAKWGHKTVENINLTRKKFVLKDTRPYLSQPYHSTPLTHPSLFDKIKIIWSHRTLIPPRPPNSKPHASANSCRGRTPAPTINKPPGTTS